MNSAPNSRFTIWTHRGRPHSEHALDSFHHAHASGINHFEIDIHLTSDGIVVLSHDATTNRVSGQEGEIEKLAWLELQNRPIDNKHSWVALEDFLRTFPDSIISIDFKSRAVTGPGIAVLEKFPDSSIILGSFSHRRIKELKNALPHFTFALSPIEILKVKFGFFTRNIRKFSTFAMIPEKYFGIPVLTKHFLRRCERMGIPIHVWVVNDPLKAENLLSRGVSGFVTDNYPLLLDHFTER